jgi:hypothetical protein
MLEVQSNVYQVKHGKRGGGGGGGKKFSEKKIVKLNL